MPARAISSGVMSGDRLAQQRHRALVRRIHARQQIERRGLAGAVGPDQRMQRAVGDGDVDALHGLDAAEALDDVAGGKHRAVDVGFRPQEFRQRQHFDAARRHRGVFDRLLAERRDQPLADADQAGRREHDEADEHQAEPEQPVLGVDADRNSRNRMKNSAPSAGPRKLRMPPITTIASSSPENGDRDRIGRGHAVLVKQQDAGKPGDAGGQHEGQRACSDWSDSRGSARAARSRGSRPARCRRSNCGSATAGSARAKAIAGDEPVIDRSRIPG